MEKELAQIFQNNFNCYAEVEPGLLHPIIMAMTMDKFIEVCMKHKMFPENLKNGKLHSK